MASRLVLEDEVMKPQKKYPVLWLLTSLVGLAGQLFQISDEYHRYDVITNVQLNIPEKVDLPVIHFCNYLRSVMDWKKMTIDQRRQILTIKNKLIIPEEELDNITLIEDVVDDSDKYFRPLAHNILTKFNFSDLSQMTMRSDDMFEATLSYDPDRMAKGKYSITGVHSGFGVFGNFSETFKTDYKCFRFDMEDKYRKGIIYKLLRNTAYAGIYSSFMFKQSNLRKVRLSLIFLQSARYPDMRMGNQAFFAIVLREKTRYFMTYNEYQLSLLPPPYTTQCLDYSTMGYSSQGDCYEKCLRKKTLDKFSRLHHAISVGPEETERVLTLFEQSYIWPVSNFSSIDKLAEIEKSCDRLCSRQQCDIHEYIPKLMCTIEDRDSTKKKSGHVLLHSFVTMSPVIQTVSMPQVTIIQFLTNLASAFGFWIGISVLGIQDALIVMSAIIKDFRVRYGNRRPSQPEIALSPPLLTNGENRPASRSSI